MEPLELELPAEPASIATARHALEDYASEAGADIVAVGLAVSEAVTNCVVHGYRQTSPGTVAVRAERDRGDALLVTVADSGVGMKANPESRGLGMGLPLISRVADAVTIEADRAEGVRIRMRFDCRAGRS